MPKTTCHEAFNNGARHRKQFPLRHGKYKIIETRDQLKSCKAEINRIRNYVSGVTDKLSLEHCTFDDKHKWLKDLPEWVSFRLGRDLLPGLPACEGDISDADFMSLQIFHLSVASSSNTLINDLEINRQRISTSIEAEYSEMRTGGSLLGPLIDDAISLFDKALRVIP